MTTAPQDVSEFLDSRHLELADIVLFRRKGSFFARNLTRLTGDFFSHAGLVFATPQTDPGFTKAYVIECTFKGVDITPFDHFLEKNAKYVICIKRFQGSWLDARLQKAIRGHALNYIKAEYSFKTLTDLFFRAEAHYLFPRRSPGHVRAQSLERAMQRDMKLPRAFICSGFVQYAFYEGIQRAIQSGSVSLTESCLSDCYFPAERRSSSLRADLLSVSPQDMAESDKLSWKYLIHRGSAYEVGSEDEVMALVHRSARERRTFAGVPAIGSILTPPRKPIPVPETKSLNARPLLWRRQSQQSS